MWRGGGRGRARRGRQAAGNLIEGAACHQRQLGPLGRWAAGPLGRWAAGPLGRWARLYTGLAALCTSSR